MLVGALDDASALGCQDIDRACPTPRRLHHRQPGCSTASIHGGCGRPKRSSIPSNRGSIVLGSVAYYMDRYGYDVLPLALKMLRGETLNCRARETQHTPDHREKHLLSCIRPYDIN